MGKFRDLCNVYASLSAMRPTEADSFGHAAVVDGWKFDPALFKDRIAKGLGDFPNKYRDVFADELVTWAPRGPDAMKCEYEKMVADGEDELFASRLVSSWVDTLAMAVEGWGCTKSQPALKRLAATTSNLHNLFEGEVRKIWEASPTVSQPPLVVLAPDGAWGPYTINSDKLNEITGIKLALVSLPEQYGNCPLLWTPLAHEVYGHDVPHGFLHGDRHIRETTTIGMQPTGSEYWEGLIGDLKKGLMSSASTVAPGNSLSEAWETIWRDVWLEEVAADVYGIVSMGPYFLVGMAGWLSAARATNPYAPYHEAGTMGNQILSRNGRPAGDHPPDILRLHAMMAAIEALPEGDEATRQQWRDLVNIVRKDIAGTVSTIDVFDVEEQQVLLQYPAQQLIADARAIGTYIATVPLPILGDKRIIELKPWAKENDAIASAFTTLATAHVAGGPLSSYDRDRCSPRHCLAGATKALFDAPGRSDTINEYLMMAIGDQFNKTFDFHP